MFAEIVFENHFHTALTTVECRAQTFMKTDHPFPAHNISIVIPVTTGGP